MSTEIKEPDEIAELVQGHLDAFILETFARYGLDTREERALLLYVRTMDEFRAIETVIRHHAALQEKLRQDEVLT